MNNIEPHHSQAKPPKLVFERHSKQLPKADVLADIYQDEVSLTVWQRSLSPELVSAAEQLLMSKHLFQISASVTPENTYESVCDALGGNKNAELISSDAAEIVEMFCCLFDLQQVGLRLTTLERAMCPRFHVDRVPCRLITTYGGVGTEWLPHNIADRSKLGIGSQGKSDEESGIYRHRSDIQQLNEGDVALLKGESWLGNEGGGLVHRSPQLSSENKRLLLTLDFN